MSEDSSSPPHSGKDWFAPGRFAVLLAVMVFIPFHDVLLGARTFAVRDFGLFSYPVAAFFATAFGAASGRFGIRSVAAARPFSPS